MTTRRRFLALAGGAIAASGIAACREPQAVATPVAVPDLVLAETERGLVRLSGAESRLLGRAAAVSRDGTIAYVADDTGLTRTYTITGASIQKTEIGGGWVPRVVAEGGNACVLTTTPYAEPPAPRTSSGLLVVGDGQRRKFNLSGVVEPDAFTTDGAGLFVLEWLPPDLPDRYRVRLLDLATGKLEPLFTRTKVPVPPGAEEEMRGSGRQAVLSPDRQVLYTLYTHQPDHQHTRNLLAGTRNDVHAFVHVLHLGERWAFCLDLPEPFGHGPPEGHALAADATHLAVLDASSGSVAFASASSLAIEKTARIPAGRAAGHLALGGGRAYAACGTEVHALARDTGRVAAQWSLADPVCGLRLGRDGRLLYAGGRDRIAWLDVSSGRVLGRAAVDGLTGLAHVG
ncbi:YncE family protein [Actinoplanes sp. NPDC048988]|uniref:YncE family protein n=1 Tax=Actinoplanes sp. NPDC048988 TaxID=3363901 RepID=UPI003717CCB6